VVVGHVPDGAGEQPPELGVVDDRPRHQAHGRVAGVEPGVDGRRDADKFEVDHEQRAAEPEGDGWLFLHQAR
jgi:hypothetical protein